LLVLDGRATLPAAVENASLGVAIPRCAANRLRSYLLADRPSTVRGFRPAYKAILYTLDDSPR